MEINSGKIVYNLIFNKNSGYIHNTIKEFCKKKLTMKDFPDNVSIGELPDYLQNEFMKEIQIKYCGGYYDSDDEYHSDSENYSDNYKRMYPEQFM